MIIFKWRKNRIFRNLIRSYYCPEYRGNEFNESLVSHFGICMHAQKIPWDWYGIPVDIEKVSNCSYTVLQSVPSTILYGTKSKMHFYNWSWQVWHINDIPVAWILSMSNLIFFRFYSLFWPKFVLFLLYTGHRQKNLFIR